MSLNQVIFIIMCLSTLINKWVGFILLAMIGFSCSNVPHGSIEVLSQKPSLFPDYTDIVVPSNIAPLNFKILGRPECVGVILQHAEETWELTGEEKIIFPQRKWREWLEKSKGSRISVNIKAQWGDKVYQFAPFYWDVSTSAIDPVLVYRKIEPGYTTTNSMSINQRNLTNFEDEVLIDNTSSGTGCINCHSFCQNNPDLMLFHSRQKNPGTYFVKDGVVEKVDTQAGQMKQAAGYPFWHPSGNCVAFSISQTRQLFYEGSTAIEVFDLSSSVIVYKLENKTAYTVSELFADSLHNNYPVFTPDGKKLIYCGGEAIRTNKDRHNLKLSLCSIDFDVDKMQFESNIDILVSASVTGKSSLHPRVSPDGRFLLYTEIDYGSFSNYHQSADLALYDLENKTYRTLREANSDQVDSYHSWSSQGGWVVFSSRRNDGYYTYPWFTQISESGKASKPFLLPQKDPDYYIYCLTSFNVPELVTDKVVLDRNLLKENVEKAPRQSFFNMP